MTPEPRDLTERRARAHTPGPWRVEISPVRGKLCVVSDDVWICGEFENQPHELRDLEAQANAELIARAPEMSALLERAAHYIAALGTVHGERCSVHEYPWTCNCGVNERVALLTELRARAG